jgi:hypothetical protein
MSNSLDRLERRLDELDAAIRRYARRPGQPNLVDDRPKRVPLDHEPRQAGSDTASDPSERVVEIAQMIQASNPALTFSAALKLASLTDEGRRAMAAYETWSRERHNAAPEAARTYAHTRDDMVALTAELERQADLWVECGAARTRAEALTRIARERPDLLKAYGELQNCTTPTQRFD